VPSSKVPVGHNAFGERNAAAGMAVLVAVAVRMDARTAVPRVSVVHMTECMASVHMVAAVEAAVRSFADRRGRHTPLTVAGADMQPDQFWIALDTKSRCNRQGKQ
jgi:hypothetical protein